MKQTIKFNVVPRDYRVVTTREPAELRSELRISYVGGQHPYEFGIYHINRDGSERQRQKPKFRLGRDELAALRDTIDAMLGEEDPWHKS